MPAPIVANQRTTIRQDLFDAALTITVAIAVALFIRTRPEPLRFPAVLPLFCIVVLTTVKSPRLRRMTNILVPGLMAGTLVSMSWFSYGG